MEADIYIDGGARGNPGPAGSGYLVISPTGEVLKSGSHFISKATNNVAEYVALIKGLEAAGELGVSELNIFTDSELLTRQLIGEYRVKNPALRVLFEQAQRILIQFSRWQIKHIPREQNRQADALVNTAIDKGLAGKSTSGSETHTPGPQAIRETNGHGDRGSVKVIVEVTTEPKAGMCPAGLRKGQCFVFSDLTPAGMCINAMQGLLPGVCAIRHGGQVKRVVRCPDGKCGAVFTVTIVS